MMQTPLLKRTALFVAIMVVGAAIPGETPARIIIGPGGGGGGVGRGGGGGGGVGGGGGGGGGGAVVATAYNLTLTPAQQAHSIYTGLLVSAYANQQLLLTAPQVTSSSSSPTGCSIYSSPLNGLKIYSALTNPAMQGGGADILNLVSSIPDMPEGVGIAAIAGATIVGYENGGVGGALLGASTSGGPYVATLYIDASIEEDGAMAGPLGLAIGLGVDFGINVAESKPPFCTSGSLPNVSVSGSCLENAGWETINSIVQPLESLDSYLAPAVSCMASSIYANASSLIGAIE